MGHYIEVKNLTSKAFFSQLKKCACGLFRTQKQHVQVNFICFISRFVPRQLFPLGSPTRKFRDGTVYLFDFFFFFAFLLCMCVCVLLVSIHYLIEEKNLKFKIRTTPFWHYFYYIQSFSSEIIMFCIFHKDLFHKIHFLL